MTAVDTFPSPRSVRHALRVLERLPAEALADLAERLVDRLDSLDGDPDLEAEIDGCEAEEAPPRPGDGPGDSTDAEPDDDDRAPGDEPLFPERLRSAREGVAEVRCQITTVRLLRQGERPNVRRMRCIPRLASE